MSAPTALGRGVMRSSHASSQSAGCAFSPARIWSSPRPTAARARLPR